MRFWIFWFEILRFEWILSEFFICVDSESCLDLVWIFGFTQKIPIFGIRGILGFLGFYGFQGGYGTAILNRRA